MADLIDRAAVLEIVASPFTSWSQTFAAIAALPSQGVPEGWHMVEGSLGSILLYTLREDGWSKGQPVMVNDVMIRIETANGSQTDVAPIARRILAALEPAEAGGVPHMETPPQTGTGKLVVKPQPFTTQNAEAGGVEALKPGQYVCERCGKVAWGGDHVCRGAPSAPAPDTVEALVKAAVDAERERCVALAYAEAQARISRQIAAGGLSGIALMHGQVAEAMKNLAAAIRECRT